MAKERAVLEARDKVDRPRPRALAITRGRKHVRIRVPPIARSNACPPAHPFIRPPACARARRLSACGSQPRRPPHARTWRRRLDVDGGRREIAGGRREIAGGRREIGRAAGDSRRTARDSWRRPDVGGGQRRRYNGAEPRCTLSNRRAPVGGG